MGGGWFLVSFAFWSKVCCSLFATTSNTPTTPTATQLSNSRPGWGRLVLVSLVPGFRLLLRQHWEAAHLKLPFSPLAPDVPWFRTPLSSCFSRAPYIERLPWEGYKRRCKTHIFWNEVWPLFIKIVAIMLSKKTIMQNNCYLLKGSPESCNSGLSTAVDLEESHCVIVSWWISKVFFVSSISKVFCITLYPGTLLKLGQPGTGSGSFCIFSKWSAIATAFQISFAAILRLQKDKPLLQLIIH